MQFFFAKDSMNAVWFGYTALPPQKKKKKKKKKKEEWQIFSTLQPQSIACLSFIGLNNFFWKEWYQDHWIWLGSFHSMAISWNTVIFIFFLFTHANGQGIYIVWPFMHFLCFVYADQSLAYFGKRKQVTYNLNQGPVSQRVAINIRFLHTQFAIELRLIPIVRVKVLGKGVGG